ncbi:MAG: Pesticin receptor [Steroidobacteraceae bacterium]|nr:Pesticin receptor [Steroidobacteraceae bacterium]
MQPKDLSGSIPGVISMPQATFPLGSTTFVRGIGATETLLTIDPPVAQYRDGIYVGHTSTLGNVDMTTLERVEVMRGPQGTLFGRNTTGGAINFVTRAPREEWGLTQQLRYGSFNEVLSATTVDTGRLGGSGVTSVLTYQHRERDGYVDDPTVRDARDPGAFANDAVFAKLKGTWDRLELEYTFDYFRTRAVPAPLQIITGNGNFLAYVSNSPALGGAALELSPSRLRTLDYADLPRQHHESSGHALTGRFNFSDSVALKSITSWRKASGRGAAATGTDGLHGISTTSGGAVQSYVGLAYNSPKEFGTRQFTQELQVVGDIGEISYTAGGFYFRETGYDNIHGRYLLALSPVLAMTVNAVTTYDVRNTSEAAYGQVGYTPSMLNDRLELTAGLRTSRDHKKANQVAAIVREGDHVFHDTTWSLSARYNWTPEIMTFIRAGTGIRAGGFNIRATPVRQEFLFQPERATSYEAGIKAQFREGKIQLNAGAFHTSYRDLQITTITGASTSGGVSGGTYSANATFRGGEIELGALPLDGLKFAVNVGYVDPTYERIIFPAPVTGIPTNYADSSRFPYVPKLNGSVDASYEMPIAGGRLIASVNYTYVGKRYFHISSIPGQNPFNNTIASQGQGILNGRLSIADINMGNAAAEVSIWSNNIANKFYRTNGIDYGALGFAGATYSEPRSIGVDLKVTF